MAEAVLFEKFSRVTAPMSATENPSALYEQCVFASIFGLALGQHYEQKHVSAVIPLYDDGSNSDGIPSLKIVTAGNFKPFPETAPEDLYTRVCAEQNALDNGLRLGDVLHGVAFLRCSWDGKGLEGNDEHSGFCMCGPCRGRTMAFLDPTKLVLVTFVGADSKNPVEAMTLKQQIEHYDFKRKKKVLAMGDEISDFIKEEVLATDKYKITVNKLPKIPSRRYKRQ